MITTNTPDVPNRKTKELIGIVKGSTVRVRWFGRDIMASLKTIVGGEIKSYTEMISKAREEATQRMIEEAKSKNADAIVNVRFTTSDIMQGASEILAYGTAIKLK